MANVADAALDAKFPRSNYVIVAARDGFVFTAPVGKFKANRFGLYDMHGNVCEWCADWYAKDYYSTSPQDDPQGPDLGTARVLRGGSWSDGSRKIQSAYRRSSVAAGRLINHGFRLARTP